MTGISYHPDADDGTLSVRDLLVSVKDGRAAECPLPYGTVYLHGTHAGIDSLCIGRGGGLCWHREIDETEARLLIIEAIDAGNSVTVDRYTAVWPSKYR